MSAQLRLGDASPPAATRAPTPRPGRDPADLAFDRWLRRELARLYDATLAEPIPEELLRLLRERP